jgi:hypothetical protein
VLERYPTAAHLARARVTSLDGIPHIDAERAAELVAAAKTSTASMVDAFTAATVQMLVRRLQETEEQIEAAEAQLLVLIRAEPGSTMNRMVDLLDSFVGIGTRSAASLAIEIGDPKRFIDEKAIVSWAGLDPVIEISGDGVIQRGISHRGNVFVRATLYNIAMSAIKHNPVIMDYYNHLVGTRKMVRQKAMVAVMAKILRIIYAMMISGNKFDPDYESKRREAIQAKQAARSNTATAAVLDQEPAAEGTPASSDVDPVRSTPGNPATPAANPLLASQKAPITRKELARRRKATAPGRPKRDQSPKGSAGRRSHADSSQARGTAKG